MFLIILCFLTPLVTAFGTELSLARFIQLAEQNDPGLKRIQQNRGRADFIKSLGLPSDGVQLSFENQHGFGISDSEKTSTIIGTISKQFIATGTKVSASHSRGRHPDRREDISELRVEQSLFRNLFGQEVRLKSMSLDNEVKIIHLETMEAYENYIKGIVDLYIDFKSSYLTLNIAKNGVHEASQLFEYLKRKHRENIAVQVDVDKAELQLLQRKEEQLAATEAMFRVNESIKAVAGIGDYTASLKTDELIEEPLQSDTKLSDMRFMNILSLRREIAQRNTEISNSSDDPSLSFIAGFNIENSDRFSSTVNRTEGVFGLKIEVPLWDSKLYAGKREAFHSLQIIQLDEQVQKQSFFKAKDEITISLKQIKEASELSQRKIELMSRILKAEDRRFRNGRIEFDRIVELQTLLQNSQISHQEKQLGYKKKIVEKLAIEDRLLEFVAKL